MAFSALPAQEKMNEPLGVMECLAGGNEEERIAGDVFSGAV